MGVADVRKLGGIWQRIKFALRLRTERVKVRYGEGLSLKFSVSIKFIVI